MKKVQVIGAAIMDILVSRADERVFQTGSSPTGGIRMSYGGDALNEATVLQCLGVPVRLETVLGEDEAGASVLRRMEAVGLDTSGVHIREGLPTSINVVLIKPDGERSFLTDPRASLRQLGMEDISLPFPEDVGILCLASMFVSPLLGMDEMAALFRQAKQQGITVCADMTRCKNGETAEAMASVLQHIDYVFPNESEALLLTRKNTVEEAAAELLRAGTGTAVIKCGARGCFVKSGAAEFWAPAAAGVTCVDSTGAGDSFAGGFLSGLAKGLPLEDCVRLANECGAKAVQNVGATAWIAP